MRTNFWGNLVDGDVTLYVDEITITESDGYMRDMYGFVNKNDEVVISHKYDHIKAILGELAIVTIYDDEKQYKVINIKGETLNEYDDLRWYGQYNKGAACLDGKWGVISERCDVICPIEYEDIALCNESTFFVRLNKKWGVINSHNELICDFKFDDLGESPDCWMPGEERVNTFNGHILDINPLIGICIDGKWGYMNAYFEVVCEPKYDYIKDFECGCAAVMVGNKVGFIDENCNEICPIKYTCTRANSCIEVMPLQDGEKFGWFDRKSRYLCEPKYEENLDWKINNEFIVVTLNGKKGVMKSNGIEVAPLQYDEIKPWFTFGYPIKIAYLVCLEGKWGVLEPNTGNYLLEPIYDEIGNEDTGVETLRIGDKYGYVYTRGGEVFKSEVIYDEIKSEWSYLIAFRKGDKWGAYSIDDDNNIVEALECKYDDIDGGYGYISLKLNGKYAYAQISSNDGSVRMICDYKYDEIYFDVDGMAAVRIGEKYGVINADGKEICEIKYDDIRHSAQPFHYEYDIKYPRLIGVKSGNKWGFINVEGEEVCPFQFDKIERWTSEFEGDSYVAYVGDVSYELDMNGTFVAHS